MKFEPSNLTSQQIQATTNKLAKPNPPPLHWPPHTTNRSEQNHPPPLHWPHKSMCWRGKKEKTAGQPPIVTHNPSHHFSCSSSSLNRFSLDSSSFTYSWRKRRIISKWSSRSFHWRKSKSSEDEELWICSSVFHRVCFFISTTCWRVLNFVFMFNFLFMFNLMWAYGLILCSYFLGFWFLDFNFVFLDLGLWFCCSCSRHT